MCGGGLPLNPLDIFPGTAGSPGPGSVGSPGPVAKVPSTTGTPTTPTTTTAPIGTESSATSPNEEQGPVDTTIRPPEAPQPSTNPNVILSDDVVPKPPLAPVAAPVAAPLPNFADPNPQETAAMKRKRLQSFRYGLLQTIKTSPLGLTSPAPVVAPGAGSGIGAGAKTRLGQ